MSTDQAHKHRSLEKTDRLPSQPGARQEPAPAPPSFESISDTRVLKDTLTEISKERDTLKRAILTLETETVALRSDFTAQKAEQLSELRTLHEVAERAHNEATLLREGLKDARAANKVLKAQNLSLQHMLNQWGVPVEAGDSSAFTLAAFEEGLDRFFPKIAPGPGDSDPIPTVLKGELANFYFPDLLHFLSSAVSRGVLTVVSDQIIAKLFLERGALLYAGWNNKDPELSLARLLEESELVPPSRIEQLSHRADFDLELAIILLSEGQTPAQTIRAGLKEHARVILGFLFHLRTGSFFFQPGDVERKKDLEFRLAVTDILLKTAAEMDEKKRQGAVTA